MRLTLEHLSKQFKNKIAVDNVNTVLKEGVYGFLGANGAGKTTLMQMVCGILSPTAGEVKVDGVNNIKMGEDFRDLLGYLPQEFGYTPGFTAKDFMLYIASIKGLMPGYAKRRSEELFELVNLKSDMNRKIRTFSGGMKRRLGIAQALLNDPKILIMDEPTAGLDPKERAYFRNVISEMSRDKIIIISTHIVSDIEFISDQVLVMKKGRFILQGTTEELIAEIEGMVWNDHQRGERHSERAAAHARCGPGRSGARGLRQRHDERRAGLREGPGGAAHRAEQPAGGAHRRDDGHGVHRVRAGQAAPEADRGNGGRAGHGGALHRPAHVRGLRQAL